MSPDQQLLEDLVKKSSLDCLNVIENNHKLMSLFTSTSDLAFILLTIVRLHATMIKLLEDPKYETARKPYLDSMRRLTGD